MGAAGLGVGFGIGWAWERYHRYRRARRKKSVVTAADERFVQPDNSREAESVAKRSVGGAREIRPRLQLVSDAQATADAPAFADLAGRELTSIRFFARAIEIEFNGLVVSTTGNPSVFREGLRYVYPEPGSRDVMCDLVGAIVARAELTDAGTLALFADDKRSLFIPRAGARLSLHER
jgi:hypothetical protein